MNKKEIVYLKNVLNTYNSKISPKRTVFLNEKIRTLLDNQKYSSYAYLIGKVVGDGHLSKVYHLKFVDGDISNLEELKRFIVSNFDVRENKASIHFKKAKGRSFVLNINYALFGRIIYCLGAPKGNKTKQRFLVPQWIVSSKEYSKRFLKALLEDELTTIRIEKKNYSINPRFKMAKEERYITNLRMFLKQVKNMIENCGVNCSNISKEPKSKSDQRTKELYFDILRNKRNIIKFKNEIGFFLHIEKVKKLNECCNILEKTLRPIINKEDVLKLRNTGLSIRRIAKELNISSSTVHRMIKT